MRRHLSRGLWLCLLWLSVACGGDGRLVISLERPKGELDPLKDARLSRFSMRITTGGRTTDSDAFLSGDDAELQVGGVPVGQAFDLRLSGRSGAGLMLGVGLVQDLEIRDGGEDTNVAIKFRKPLGYVAGHSRVQVVDVAAASSAKLELKPLSIGSGRAVAATPSGVLALVASGRTLVPVRTLDHVALPAVNLSADGDCLAVSPDSRWAVICHRSARTVGLVDLRAVSQGKAKEQVLAVGGAPHRVVFGDSRTQATVLLEGLRRQTSCAGAASSRLVAVNLEHRKASAPRSMGRPVADVALDPRDGSLLLALTCDSKLRRVQGSNVIEEATVPSGAYDITVADRNIVLMGRGAGASVQGQAMMFDLTRPVSTGKSLAAPEAKTFSIPPILIRLKFSGSPSGYLAWASEPKEFKIYDVAISPDSQRALCLLEATYHSNMGSNCQYRTNIKAVGYMLVDLTTGAVLVQRFTSLKFNDCYSNCVVNQAGQYLNTPGRCSAEFRRVLQKEGLLLSNTAEFEPAGATLLFGE